ncbi:MAG TPA: hypothetical protein VGM90_30525 [Kofleriaceae bacterium]|jgi:hypothetical protein
MRRLLFGLLVICACGDDKSVPLDGPPVADPEPDAAPVLNDLRCVGSKIEMYFTSGWSMWIDCNHVGIYAGIDKTCATLANGSAACVDADETTCIPAQTSCEGDPLVERQCLATANGGRWNTAPAPCDAGSLCTFSTRTLHNGLPGGCYAIADTCMTGVSPQCENGVLRRCELVPASGNTHVWTHYTCPQGCPISPAGASDCY